jgi:hypothetical protein
MVMAEERGPIEDGHWAGQLRAHVVDPGPPPRLHGYDLWHDLAKSYGLAEIVLTALLGEAPDRARGRAFEVALVLAMPGSLAEAPAHAAAIARMLSAPPPSIAAMAAVVLAEQAQALIEAHDDWIAWLERGEGDPPATGLARDDGDRESLAVVRTLVDPSVAPVLARVEPSTSATIVTLLFASGLRTRPAMIAALVCARLPGTVAEAEHHTRAGLRSYPMQLPPFDYREDP